MATVKQLQAQLDTIYYGECIITTEGLTDKAICENKLRIANYGVECEYGETVMIGTIPEIEQWIKQKKG